MTNLYRLLGILLVIIGLAFAWIFYFIIPSVPLEGVGLSAIILGLTSLFLANARLRISPEVCQVLMKTGAKNITELLDELEIKNKAIYFPRNMRDGQAQALIPLIEGQDVRKLKEKLPGYLITKSAPVSDGTAIAVTTQGNISLEYLQKEPGPTADGIQTAINYILNRVMDIADRVRVDMVDSTIDVKVTGTEVGYDSTPYYQCLGGLIASISAAVSSEALVKPVRIKEEIHKKGTSKIVLEVLN